MKYVEVRGHMIEMVCHCFKFWASKQCFDWLPFMSAIDEFSIKQDYTSVTLHVQGLTLAGRKPKGLSVFRSPETNAYLTASLMSGDQYCSCGSFGRAGRVLINEGPAVQMPAPTVRMLKCPWARQALNLAAVTDWRMDVSFQLSSCSDDGGHVAKVNSLPRWRNQFEKIEFCSMACSTAGKRNQTVEHRGGHGELRKNVMFKLHSAGTKAFKMCQENVPENH